MTSPGGIGPDRLGEIVDGAAPRDDEERALLALLEETRALEPGAPEGLRRRVLDGPPPRRASRRESARAWLGSARGRRGLMVGAPVVAGIIALAVAIPALDGGGHPSSAPGDAAEAPAGASTGATAAGAPAPEAAPGFDRAKAPSAPSPAPASGAGGGAAVAPGVTAPTGTDGRRAQQVTAYTRVQVSGVTALSRASTSAMRTVRALGGFTASSDYSVPNGSSGTNRLVFRVPVGRAQDALAAFGRLGTVTGQSADIVDLTPRLRRQTSAVGKLQVRVADLRAQAAARPGDGKLAARLAAAEASLARAQAAQAATRNRAALATLRLTLTTEGPPPPPTSAGRFGGPIARAGDRLAAATAWLLGALVLVGPFLVVGGLAAWGVARLRARAERRLMGSA